MPTDYTAAIRRHGRAALLELWRRLDEGKRIRGWPGGRAMEYLLLRAFELEGAEVRWPYMVSHAGMVVEQVDGVVYAGGLACIVEAKDHDENVDFEPIAKLRSRLLRRPASVVGVVFSRSGFTEPAKVLTRYTMPQTILLWEGEELSYALERSLMCQGLQLKFRHAVEHGLPDYHLMSGELR